MIYVEIKSVINHSQYFYMLDVGNWILYNIGLTSFKKDETKYLLILSTPLFSINFAFFVVNEEVSCIMVHRV